MKDTNALTQTESDFINEQLEEGFDYGQIADAMEDGECLSRLDLTQTEVENIHYFAKHR